MVSLPADEEWELRMAVMRADLGLKTKQAFWETPRNIGILIGVVAALAGALGFKLGQMPPQGQAPVIIQLAPGVAVAPLK